MTATTIVIIAIAYPILALCAWSIFYVGARDDPSRYGADEYAHGDHPHLPVEMTYSFHGESHYTNTDPIIVGIRKINGGDQ